MKNIALGMVRFYQTSFSPAMHKQCRFIPTCSEYTYEAIGNFGVFKGIWLGIKRISKCHPLNEGGYDPVPK